MSTEKLTLAQLPGRLALGGARSLGLNRGGSDVVPVPEPESIPRPNLVASSDGTVIPTSRASLEGGLQRAGFPSEPTSSAGIEYTLPDGSRVRIMEPSGQAPLRASFTNANGGPINPFTGKPVQPPAGLTPAERVAYVRSYTHLELGP